MYYAVKKGGKERVERGLAPSMCVCVCVGEGGREGEREIESSYIIQRREKVWAIYIFETMHTIVIIIKVMMLPFSLFLFFFLRSFDCFFQRKILGRHCLFIDE